MFMYYLYCLASKTQAYTFFHLGCEIFNKSKSPSQWVAGKSETEKIVSKSFCAQSKHFPLSINHAFGCSYQLIPSLLNGFASLNVAKVKHSPVFRPSLQRSWSTASSRRRTPKKRHFQLKNTILTKTRAFHWFFSSCIAVLNFSWNKLTINYTFKTSFYDFLTLSY